jgi:hypothetical protein
MAVNKTYYWRCDEKNAAGTTTGDVWSFTTECFPGISTDAKYIQWNTVNKPDCWCSVITPRQCHGDADNAKETKSNFWVYVNDLAVLKAGWGKTAAQLNGQVGGTPAVPQVCSDFDHVSETKSSFRVYVNDLAILKANWGKANLPAPDCSNYGY